MTRFLIIPALLAAIATPALAERSRDSREVEIAGEAKPACVIKGPALARGTNVTFAASGTAAGEIRISQLVDPSTAQAREASVALSLPIICNSAHRFVLKSGNQGLVREGAGAPGGQFRERLPYEVSARWQGQSLQGSTDSGGDFVIDNAGGAAGDLSLDITVQPGGAPLVSGVYSDIITLELQVAS
jgi:hypothetical protein